MGVAMGVALRPSSTPLHVYCADDTADHVEDTSHALRSERKAKGEHFPCSPPSGAKRD